MNVITIFSIISALFLFGFIIWGIVRFGLLPSYSCYSSKWDEAVPINSGNLWSFVTIIAAFLVLPGMLEVCAVSAWQFIAFLVPIYLIVISLTPDWQTNETQYIVHMIFAIFCISGGLFWVLFIMRAFRVFAVTLILLATLGIFTRRLRSSALFWLELLLFICVYAVIFMVLL